MDLEQLEGIVRMGLNLDRSYQLSIFYKLPEPGEGDEGGAVVDQSAQVTTRMGNERPCLKHRNC